MLQDTARLREEFDRIALASVDQPAEDRYQELLLRHVPRPCENALDVGCGTGSLARALASRAGHVQAIDLSPAMIQVARERLVTHPNVEFTVGDFLTLDLPADHFDCIAAVALLHHLDWTPAVERAKRLLRPGGVLLILDLVEDDGPADFVLSAIAWSLRTLGALGRRQPPELRAAWDAHGRGDSYPTMSQVRRRCREVLPGARIRRHLFWRYSVVWKKT